MRVANSFTSYQDAYFRAEYHIWCALRGHMAAGNDPIDGGVKPSSPLWRGEGRAANIALGRYWLKVAAQIREANEKRIAAYAGLQA